MAALGTTSHAFAYGLLDQLVDAGSKGAKADEDGISGERCRAPAVTGWTVCRFHGAGGGGPKGKHNGNYKHGLFTAEAVHMRRTISALVRASRQSLADLSGKYK